MCAEKQGIAAKGNLDAAQRQAIMMINDYVGVSGYGVRSLPGHQRTLRRR
jgi:hypothetical protein